MDKRIQKLKDNFGELAEVVNTFRSEAVQIRVIGWLLKVIDVDETSNNRRFLHHENSHSLKINRPGATKMLNRLLLTDFFNTPHTIAEIVRYANEQFNTAIEPSQFSGVLIHLVQTQRLKRERTEIDRSYRYSKP